MLTKNYVNRTKSATTERLNFPKEMNISVAYMMDL